MTIAWKAVESTVGENSPQDRAKSHFGLYGDSAVDCRGFLNPRSIAAGCSRTTRVATIKALFGIPSEIADHARDGEGGIAIPSAADGDGGRASKIDAGIALFREINSTVAIAAVPPGAFDVS